MGNPRVLLGSLVCTVGVVALAGGVVFWIRSTAPSPQPDGMTLMEDTPRRFQFANHEFQWRAASQPIDKIASEIASSARREFERAALMSSADADLIADQLARRVSIMLSPERERFRATATSFGGVAQSDWLFDIEPDEEAAWKRRSRVFRDAELGVPWIRRIDPRRTDLELAPGTILRSVGRSSKDPFRYDPPAVDASSAVEVLIPMTCSLPEAGSVVCTVGIRFVQDSIAERMGIRWRQYEMNLYLGGDAFNTPLPAPLF